MTRFIAASLIVAMIGSATYISYAPPAGYPGGREPAPKADHASTPASASASTRDESFKPGNLTPYIQQIATPANDPGRSIKARCRAVSDDDTVKIAPDGLVSQALPDSVGQGYYRCMSGAVMLCTIGANTICAKPQNTVGAGALFQFCRDEPEAPLVPRSITGHATSRYWRCRSGRPLEIASDPLDARGFVASAWTALAEPHAEAPVRKAAASGYKAVTTVDADLSNTELKKLEAIAKTVDLREFRGECQQFKMAGRNLKVDCRPVLIANHHDNGRNSFIFAAAGNVMSFAGDKSTIEYDGLMYTLTLDQVVLNDGTRTTNLPASGTCEYTPSKPGEFDIVGCHAESGGQRYDATFVTARSQPGNRTKPLVTRAEETGYRKIFPRSMQGIWTSHDKDCRLYKQRGIAALTADKRILWIEIAGDTIAGPTADGLSGRAAAGMST
jgi:hypothetical protein